MKKFYPVGGSGFVYIAGKMSKRKRLVPLALSLALLAGLLAIPAATSNGDFFDVPTSHWAYDTVKWAVDRGITNGTSATSFSPNATCTKAQIVTFLYRALK